MIRRLAACLGLLAAAAQAQTWSFDSDLGGFPALADGNRSRSGLANGSYYLRVCKPSVTALRIPGAKVSGDFVLEADLRYANACWWDSYGLAFGPDPALSTRYVVAWIQGDLGCQRYQVFKVAAAAAGAPPVTTQLFPDWFFPLYQFNEGSAWNHWKLERRGNSFSFHLNGHFAFQLTDAEHWPEVYVGVVASTFENSCDGPVNQTECVQGSEIRFDNLSLEPLAPSSGCARLQDCATTERCESRVCTSAPSCSSQACSPSEVCTLPQQRCVAAAAGLSPRTVEGALRAGHDWVFALPAARLGNDELLSVQGPDGAWLTPVALGQVGQEKLFGLARLERGTYYLELSRQMIVNHASTCGTDRNNHPITELEPVGTAYLECL